MPRPAASRSTSTGKCLASSQATALGAMRSSAKALAISRIARWSELSANMGVIRLLCRCEHIGDRRLEARRGEAHEPFREDARLGDLALAALVMNQHAPFGVEDEIMHDARQREIAGELCAVIARNGAWRENLDDHHRICRFDCVGRHERATIDE